MSYCTLEEAWGSDFKRKKKSRKEKKLESQEQKMLKDSIAPQILIPETHRMADYRKDLTQDDLPKPDTSSIMGYDDSLDVFGVHAVGGIIGAILTGVCASTEWGGSGIDGTISSQVMIQTKSVLFTIIYTGVLTAIIIILYKVYNIFILYAYIYI